MGRVLIIEGEVKMNFYSLIEDNNRLLHKRICELLKSNKPIYKNVWFVFGISQESGYLLIKEDIESFIRSGGTVNFVISVDNKNTTANYLNTLLEDKINTWIFNNNTTVFKRNPHMIIFEAEDLSAEVIITSADFTENGLLNNYETTIDLNFDNQKEYDEFRRSAEQYLKPDEKTYIRLTADSIKKLQENNELMCNNFDSIPKLHNINELIRGFRKKDSINTKKIIENLIEQQNIQNDQIASTRETVASQPKPKHYDSEDDILIDINI